jgi:hypothetical protein
MGIVLANEGHEGRTDGSNDSAVAPGKPKSNPVFDSWLTHHLSQLYDPVIEEPIPAALLKLLEERLG